MDRRTFVKATGVAGIAGLAGCSGGPTGGSDDDTETEASGGDGSGDSGGEETTTEPSDDGPAANIGMVYATGGLGDGSFNDQAQQGAIEAEEELGVSYNEAQPDEVSQFSTFQQQFAQSTDPDYDLVCCIGFLQADALSETSADYPEQNFMLVDAAVDASNVDNYVFAEHEGSYLAGLMASLLTTRDFSAGAGSTAGDSTNVGFVGGVDSPVIRRFQAGFEAGVDYASDDVDVTTSYVGSYADPSGGQEQALSMYQSGADIVYHAAGATGVGVFQAAQDEGRFAFGVDQDQSVSEESFADVILASMVKRVDTAVYESISNVIDDDHQGGETVALGLESNGVECVYGQEIGDQVPDEIVTAVSDARDEIIAGNIDVPETTSN